MSAAERCERCGLPDCETIEAVEATVGLPGFGKQCTPEQDEILAKAGQAVSVCYRRPAVNWHKECAAAEQRVAALEAGLREACSARTGRRTMSDVDKMERDIAEVTPLLRYDAALAVQDAGGDWLRCDPEIVAIIAAAPAIIARVRELEAGLREACDVLASAVDLLDSEMGLDEDELDEELSRIDRLRALLEVRP